MNDTYRFIIKKETRDFIYSYKSILMILFITLYPILWRLNGKVLSEVLYIAFFQMSQGQFIYDSFLMDSKGKGIFFFINMKYSFEQLFLIKLSIAFIQVIIAAAVNWQDMILYFNLPDLLWIIPLILQASFLMFIGSVISDGAELSTAFILTGLIFVLTFVILLAPVIIRVIVAFALLGISYFVAKKLYYSKLYRSQV